MNHHNPQSTNGPHVTAFLTKATKLAPPSQGKVLATGYNTTPPASATPLPRQRIVGVKDVAGIERRLSARL